MNKRARYILITILSAISLTGFSQKVPKVLEAKVEDQVKKTIATLEKQFSSMYTSLGETEFRFDSTALRRTRSLFYKNNDPAFTHISPNIMDPAKEFGKSAYFSDTNLLPKNYLVPAREFLDTLKAWYCNDSCLTALELSIINPKYDWDNIYYDPQLLCMRVYYTITLLGEPFVPRLNDMMSTMAGEQGQKDDLDQYFEETVELTGQIYTSGTIIFLFTLDNQNIKDSYIYKVYDNVIDNSVFVEDVRKIISERNKYYISVRPYIGSSILKADFSDIDNFQQTDEFQPYTGIHIDFNYYFNDGPRAFTKGIGAGVGISRFNATGTVTDYEESFTEFSEPFNMDYTKFVYADNIQENLVLDYVDVNVLFKMRYRLFKNMELIGSIGPQASILVNSTIDPSTGDDGYVTYTGLFEDVPFPDGSTQTFLLEDVPEYGFTTYTDLTYKEDEIGISTFNFCAYADLGLNLKLSHKFHLAFGVGYMYGFGNLVEESSDEEFVLSKGDGEVDNIFKNCSSLKIKAPSAFISVSYLLNSKIK